MTPKIIPRNNGHCVHLCVPKKRLTIYKYQRGSTMAQAVRRRLAVPWLRRSVIGWPCHGSDGQSSVGSDMAQAVSRRLAVSWFGRSVADWPCHGSGGQSSVGSAMVQAVSRRHLTAEVHVRSQDSPCEVCGAQSGTVTGFSPSTSVSNLSIIPPMLHTHLHLCAALTRRTTWQNVRTFQKGILFRKFGER